MGLNDRMGVIFDLDGEIMAESDYQEIIDRLVGLELELKSKIKSVKMDLLQLAVTAVVILMLMEDGLKTLYSVLIGAIGVGLVRIIYDHRDRVTAIYRESCLPKDRENISKKK